MNTMNAYLRPPKRSNLGFSLLELLTVISIMVVMIGLGVPAFNSMNRGMKLTQSAQILTDQMAVARQMALSTNRQIEVRLYKFSDPGVPNNSNRVQALQLFEAPLSTAISDGVDKLGYRPISKFIRLAGSSVIIDSGNTLSTLIGQASGGPTVPTLSSGSELGYPIPQVGTSYSAIRFSYMADGSTNLPAQNAALQWFLTVHDAQVGDNLQTPPSNFATIQIQPSNGKIRTYHP